MTTKALPLAVSSSAAQIGIDIKNEYTDIPAVGLSPCIEECQGQPARPSVGHGRHLTCPWPEGSSTWWQSWMGTAGPWCPGD